MIDAGTRLFAEREYRAVSMEEIAAAADVSKPMVYSYFGSKQGLFMACIDHWTEQLLDELDAATPPELPPDVRMWRGLLAVFSFIEARPDAWALLYPHGPQAGGQLAAGAERTREAITGLLTQLLRDAAVAGGVDPKVAGEATEPIAHALGAAVQAVAAWWLRGSDEPKERQALRLMNFVWVGLEDLMQGRLWLPPPDGAMDVESSATAGAPASDLALARQLRADRDGVLGAIFDGMAGRVNPTHVEGVDAVVEWRVSRPEGGHDRYQLAIADGGCSAARDGDAEPDAVLLIDGDDLLDLVTGRVGGAELFTFGKMKVEGDMLLAARMPRFFEGAAP